MTVKCATRRHVLFQRLAGHLRSLPGRTAADIRAGLIAGFDKLWYG